jgi:hypothetical protein
MAERTHFEEVGGPAALEALLARGLPVDTTTARSLAHDYLTDAGHSGVAADYAVTRAYLAEAPPSPQEGPCHVCGEPECDWNDGAAFFLCADHWNSY